VVHDLPDIHDYWAHRYVMPLLSEVGVTGINDLWRDELAAQCRRRAPESATLVSIGAGNGDLELSLAGALAAEGLENLEIVLLELNTDMIDRAMAEARRIGVEDRVRGERVDLNHWRAIGTADVYLANHTLHHVVELEHLYAQVYAGMDPDGVLLVNDMIGRNGHVRWPEAALAVHRIWAQLPERYRYNRSLGRVDDVYPDLDCSLGGFEGIRSQDVLPLLLGRFHPEIYVTFANVIDPFVDRVYGHNFDGSREEDAAIIDAIASADEAGLDAGIYTPTHLVGTFRRGAVECRYPRQRSPTRTVHPPPPASDAVADDDSGLRSRAAPAVAVADGRYEALRARKAVRLALRMADARTRLGRRFRHVRR
jgi:SAM-dependent methyltransferase